MPAFGKSGTCLMRCFKSINGLRLGRDAGPEGRGLHDCKWCTQALWELVVGVEGRHASPSWTGAQRAFDARHRLRLPLHQRFYPTVRFIADPSGHAFAHGDVLGEPAEADTLDASADRESTGDDH